MDQFNTQTVFKWADPFDWRLWLVVVALVLCSGATDWVLERNYVEGHKFTSV